MIKWLPFGNQLSNKLMYFMSLEQPYSTIKKAVEGSANEMARSELLEKPEARHYDKVFQLLKQLRDFDSSLLENIIIISARGKNLAEKLGPGLEKEFREVVDELNENIEKKAKLGIKQIKSTIKDPKSIIDEKNKFALRLIEELILQLKTDLRIVSAFDGKELLLEEATAFMQDSLTLILNNLND
jgi:hypothetical protein